MPNWKFKTKHFSILWLLWNKKWIPWGCNWCLEIETTTMAVEVMATVVVIVVEDQRKKEEWILLLIWLLEWWEIWLPVFHLNPIVNPQSVYQTLIILVCLNNNNNISININIILNISITSTARRGSRDPVRSRWVLASLLSRFIRDRKTDRHFSCSLPSSLRSISTLILAKGPSSVLIPVVADPSRSNPISEDIKRHMQLGRNEQPIRFQKESKSIPSLVPTLPEARTSMLASIDLTLRIQDTKLESLPLLLLLLQTSAHLQSQAKPSNITKQMNSTAGWLFREKVLFVLLVQVERLLPPRISPLENDSREWWELTKCWPPVFLAFVKSQQQQQQQHSIAFFSYLKKQTTVSFRRLFSLVLVLILAHSLFLEPAPFSSCIWNVPFQRSQSALALGGFFVTLPKNLTLSLFD